MKTIQFRMRVITALFTACMAFGTIFSDVGTITARAKNVCSEYFSDYATGENEDVDATPVLDSEDNNRIIDVWDFGAKEESDIKLYANNITPQAWLDKNIIGDGMNGTTKGEFIGSDGTVTFGDLSLTFWKGDRLYSGVMDLSGISYGSNGNAVREYEDGYQSAGGWYMRGTGGSNRRYVVIDNVQAGDKIIAYVGNHSGSGENTDTSFFFEYMGEDGTQKDSVDIDAGKFQKCEFTAEYTGSYKIWENNCCKPMFHRIIRVPGVKVSGTIDFGTYQGAKHSLKFVNQTTKKETIAILDGSDFSVILTPGFTYMAVFSGTAVYKISDDSKIVKITDAESVTGKESVDLKLVMKDNIYTYSGKVTGFADDYALSNFAVILTPPKNLYLDEVILTVDENLNFSAILEQGYEYTISISGVNDYELKSSDKIISMTDVTEDIIVGLKDTYDVTGGFIGLKSEKIKKLEFVNTDDDYVYTAFVSDNGYSVKLRDGLYLAKAVAGDYSTQTHVVVDGKAISKDLLFVSTDEKENIPWAAHVYVGYSNKENNYHTVKEAIEACKLMNPRDEKHRIKVHIAPGVYREQVIVETPYISFVNDTDEKVVLTWYYGTGYKYYSADASGFYNPENGFDRIYKNEVDNRGLWGVTVLVTETATAFRAEGITFENSFNRYITEEEIADGVETSDSGEGKDMLVRGRGTDVQSQNASQRACALAICADQAEFKNCGFFSCMDTLFTSRKSHRAYFRNCIIEGQKYCIFGDGSCIFDDCELRWKGYSSGSTGGRFTANLGVLGSGYLFRDCTVTANSELTVAGGVWGIPWRESAKVIFINTKLENEGLITEAGWEDFDNCYANNAYLYEYNTVTMDGQAVDTSKRGNHVLTAEQASAISNADYFGKWVPAFYKEKVEKRELKDFAVVPVGDKVYGDETFPLFVTGEEDAAGAVMFVSSDDSVIRIKENNAVILKAGTAVITAIKAEDDVYCESVAELVVKVNRKELTVRAENKLNIIQGSDMPKFTFKTEGLVNGDVVQSLSMETAVNNTDVVGIYEIIVSNALVENESQINMTDSYEITYINGKIEIAEDPDRVAGTGRYETSLQSAETLKELKGVEQFETVVIAAGADFPDALAGSTLAAAKDAPILLAGKDLSSETKATLEYVAENVKPGGEIYILGGCAAVSEEAEKQLRTEGFKVTRIAGTNRYETNMKLMENLNVHEGTDVIIASGKNYPDSIAVSGIAGAMGMPIILTNEKLADEALDKIKEIKPEHIYIIGGTSAVSQTVEEQIKGIGEVKRVAGTNRFLTSIEIANVFDLQNAEAVVIAYGNNFPDGLTGSVIAAETNAPILLVSDSNYRDQAEFIKNCNIKSYYILGGTGVISEDTVKELLGL